MSVFEIAKEHGSWRLAGFAVAVLLFLAVGLLRWPLLLTARLLLAVQSGLDARITHSFAGNVPAPQETG
ncbi:hypothetical protein SAMN04489729_4241 [Amycolatopsis lurida]|jgi:hypothetical protein|uniref:Uncharacterized protein n=1 Tax=Amycolatopsis lurida NRRL 2430 TaxID=1460371 RepID=A0A2P2G1S8_AMYLU|nr:hypothetical protein [Amycolatopsis lurida]KFU82927.1 hypothetical protein BB31_00100 [Amycolatopsis lurida NRRL 2430]SED40020.1 hypothetical protein SAMN04489729_4241 [Amycolatopsis lurida]